MASYQHLCARGQTYDQWKRNVLESSKNSDSDQEYPESYLRALYNYSQMPTSEFYLDEWKKESTQYWYVRARQRKHAHTTQQLLECAFLNLCDKLNIPS